MSANSSGSRGFDSGSLHQRYLAERDKRLRHDGESQYMEASGDFSAFAADPYVEPGFTRAPIEQSVDVVIVGGGFGGLLTGAELVRAGVRSFLIIEQAGDFGGTWYWNRYPGVRCDIEASIYMPLLEEVGTVPTMRYASGAEIFKHAQALGRHFGLYDHALFQTKVDAMTWDDDSGTWAVTTDRHDRLRARFVCVSQGPLAKVKLPGIPGIREYQGHMFHSARWDYRFTGGSPDGGLDRLADKRVAVIGTGATAVQIVPKLAEHAARLFVFQRTPSAIDVRDNSPADPAWFANQPRDWQRRRMENFLEVVSGQPVDSFLVGDHWGDLWIRFNELMQTRFKPGTGIRPEDLMQQADYEKMEDLRARVSDLVSDPALAEKLKPWYNFLCKRPLFSDEFLQVFNQPNVELVDTDGRGVERITSSGVVANGRHVPVDCIVLATGFDVGAPPHKVGQYRVTGRGGLTLDQKWTGLRSLHGTQFNGFPNFHIVGGTAQGTTAFNFTHVLLMQAEHAVAIIGHCLASDIQTFEVTVAAEDRWQQQLEAKHVDHQKFYEECTPGFLNNEGNFKDKPTYIAGTYGGGPLEYERLITAWRASDMESEATIRRRAAW